MTDGEINALADQVETAGAGDAAVEDRVAEALATAFGEAPGLPAQSSEFLETTDAALHVLDTMAPGWEISIRGIAREPDGHWTCTLRESSVTDDDAVIGIGSSPALPCALIAALLRLGAMRLPRQSAVS